jgi:TetR/AcrR family transcriptional regulator, cholesterol catabolism regulator
MATTRARRRHEKQERVAEILVAAQKVLARRPYSELTMADVAREAGLAKSTLFLYFSTREGLFLLVLELQLTGFFEDLTRGLSPESRTRWTPQAAARWLAGLLEQHAQMTRLLVLLHPVLEQNVEEAKLLRFREFLLGNLVAAGDLLERRVTLLDPGEGARLLLRSFALVSGLWQMTEPGPKLKELFRRPEMAPLNLDFRGELTRSLAALVAGMSSKEAREAVR